VSDTDFGSLDGWRSPSPRLLTLRRLEVVAALGAVGWGLALVGAVLVLGVLVDVHALLRDRDTAEIGSVLVELVDNARAARAAA
jgi:hypothetical protein